MKNIRTLAFMLLTVVLFALAVPYAAHAVTYSGDTEITDSGSYEDGEYSSATADQNALLITGSDAAPTITAPTLAKSGSSSSGDDCNFYGINSGLLAKSGAAPVISGGVFSTSASGANGIFSYGGATSYSEAGDGTTITISNASITTTGDNSGGIMATGGGVINATSLDITTSGSSSAAIRTDRYGGAVTVSKGSYTANGAGSPAIYCTADIVVSDAVLTATDAEAVVVEGKNSVVLTDCTVTGDMEERSGQNYSYQGVFLYQSMSGDSDTGTSSFSMTGGSLTLSFKNESGYKRSAFHITNTDSVISLEDVDISADDKDYLIMCDGNSAGWGTAGSNGGVCSFTAANQALEGDIYVDTISELDLYLKDGSVWTGASEIPTNSVNTSPSDAPFSVSMASGTKWIVTGDSTVTNLTAPSGASITDADGNTVTIVADGAVVTDGSSDYTVTVTGTYSGPSSDGTAVTGVSVTPAEVTLSVGSTTELTASVTPSTAEETSVAWSTSDSSVAAVSDEGVVTGVAVGTAEITATTTDGGYTASCSVTVAENGGTAVTGVSVTPAEVTLSVGSTTELTASVTPSTAEETSVAWSTSDSSVAAVSDEGVVTGVAVGSATITATAADGGYSDSCSVTVTKGGSSGGSGCNTGLGAFALIVLVPVIFKKRR